MRKLLTIVLLLVLLLGDIITTPCIAYQLRPMNLGDTSYFDGLNFPSGHGWFFLLTTEYYQSHKFTNNSGNNIGGVPSPDLNTTVMLPQLVYETKAKPILNAHVGLNAIQPFLVNINLEQPNLLGLTDNGTGAGDLLTGMFLQWDTIMQHGHPFFGTRVEFDVYLPSGKYTVAHNINPGTNTYSFEPYWAGTLFFTPKWELSWRWHYMFNMQNPANHIEAGQATHVNMATSYAITQQLHLGISGYYLKQLTDSEFAGLAIPNSRDQVLGIGPGFAYMASKKFYISANYYHESDVRNRPQGNRASVFLAYSFD